MIKTITARIALLAAAFVALGTAAFAESEIIKLEAKASYYGEEFNGKPTSSGEIFDMNALTAAHKTLPFGTLLEVTNLENGKKVTVRVNDRGPFVDDRELDMSKAAAARIGILDAGLGRVSIRKVGMADTHAVAAADPTETGVARSATATNGDASRSPARGTGPASGANGAAGSATAAALAPETPPKTPSNQPGSVVGSTAGAMPATPAATPPAPTPALVDGAARPVSGSAARSTKGAQSLETKEDGAVPNTPVPALAATASPSGPRWRIQLGSFSREDNATRLVVRLRKDGFNPAFEKTATVTRVVIAGIGDGVLAGIRGKLDHAGYTGYIVRQEAW